jgi:hypothetical protein
MAPDLGSSARHIQRRIAMRVGGWCAADGPKDKQDVDVFFSGTLDPLHCIIVILFDLLKK